MADWQRGCVYTCLIGNYEKLNEQPISPQSSVPFICLTDDAGLQSSTWRIVRIEPLFPMDPVRSQRMLKLLPHRFLPDFELSLYIDNSVILKKKPEEIFDRYLASADFALPIHSFRDRVIEEFIEVAELAKDDPNRIFEQWDHYRASDPDALAERPYWTGILLRRHTSADARRALEHWAAHVLRYSRRDQLSANAVFRLARLQPLGLDIDNHESWFHTWPHARGRALRPANSPGVPLPDKIAAQDEQLARAKVQFMRDTEKIAAKPSWRSWRLTGLVRSLYRRWSRRTGSLKAAGRDRRRS